MATTTPPRRTGPSAPLGDRPTSDAADLATGGLPPLADGGDGARIARRRRTFEAFGPFAIIAAILSIVALVIAFSAAQSSGDEADRAVSKALEGQEAAGGPEGGFSTPAERLAELPDATADNWDIEAKVLDIETEPVAAGPKTIELVATERNVKVGDKVYEMWTFNDQVPGPTMRVVQGDEVTIKIKNAGDSTFFHSVDFHASRLTMGGGHVQVGPGEEGEFTFTAEYPGIFMYHCATPPVAHHIGMGMYGMLIVQPKEGFGKPMRELAVVQSELYGSTRAIDADMATQMAFNGVPGGYIDEPVKVDAGEEVRMLVLNAGPSQLSSFHVVGTVFDRVLAEGNPRNETWGRQAIAIPASGGAVFEMEMVDEGQFPFVTHQFDDVANGAVGMIIAGDGKPGPGGLEAGGGGH